jgi:hypothetical protein
MYKDFSRLANKIGVPVVYAPDFRNGKVASFDLLASKS